MGTGDLHLASLRWVDQTVRQVALRVEHPWVEPKVGQAVWPADPEVEHPWVAVSYTHLTLPTKRIV